MKFSVIDKLKNLFINSHSLYFITNSTAYKELKSNGTLSNDNESCIFIGEYHDSKSNNK